MNSDTPYLQRLDWDNDDGINLPMINDFLRNQFYDRVIARYAKDQLCTDIGFGTGLLSMLAIKHGAKHIQAFESDSNRYQLGLEIIDRLGMADKIELINKRFTRDDGYRPVVFSETVSHTLWAEGLWHSLPKSGKQIFLPGTYFLEIWAASISISFAQGLMRPKHNQKSFSPGVDIDTRFVALINEFLGNRLPAQGVLPMGLVEFQYQKENDWGWMPHMKIVQTGTVVAKYEISQWYEGIDQIKLEIPRFQLPPGPILLVPRAGMIQDEYKLYLDTACWGPTPNPILFNSNDHNIKISHDLNNGDITYLLER